MFKFTGKTESNEKVNFNFNLIPAIPLRTTFTKSTNRIGQGLSASASISSFPSLEHLNFERFKQRSTAFVSSTPSKATTMIWSNKLFGISQTNLHSSQPFPQRSMSVISVNSYADDVFVDAIADPLLTPNLEIISSSSSASDSSSSFNNGNVSEYFTAIEDESPVVANNDDDDDVKQDLSVMKETDDFGLEIERLYGKYVRKMLNTEPTNRRMGIRV